MMTINSISMRNDIENYRSKLSKTNVQKRRLDSIKEGFLVNNFVKDSINNNQIDLEGNFIIPPKKEIACNFKSKKSPFAPIKKIVENPLFPICITALGVIGGVSLATKILHSTTKLNLNTNKLERLPNLPRNMNLNSENDFVTYIAIQNPNIKTILGAFATISFAGGVFVMKNFVDGFKDIWVKKQDANIQRDLQENLIEVEAKSFAGKNNIIRNLMREKSDEMKTIYNNSIKLKPYLHPAFEGFLNFKGKLNQEKDNKKKQNSHILYGIIGITTLALCTLLTKKTISNIKAIGSEISNYNSKIHNKMDTLISSSSAEVLKENKDNLLDIFSILNFKPQYVREKLTKAGFEESEVSSFIASLEKKYRVFVDAPEALGGKQGIQYYSYIDDVQGHLYNWIMNSNNGTTGQFTKNLFVALATVAGMGYLGKNAVEAVKDVQVKKYNAQTDLDLHKRLVEVELKNFETKKRSNIDVLMNEFKKTAKINENKEKLESMANEILYEIKNGAPFVYS